MKTIAFNIVTTLFILAIIGIILTVAFDALPK